MTLEEIAELFCRYVNAHVHHDLQGIAGTVEQAVAIAELRELWQDMMVRRLLEFDLGD